MLRTIFILIALAATAGAEVFIASEIFGSSLGGWKAESRQAADYTVSGSRYRTYRPEVTPTPNGGIFVSLRIDHRRGWLAADDTASLELSFGPGGELESAVSVLAFQGQKITSDVIRGGSRAGTAIVGTAMDHAVKIGAELVADLSAKLLREQFAEPGRVAYPAAIRHNFNLLFAAVRVDSGEEGVAPQAPAGAAAVEAAEKSAAEPGGQEKKTTEEKEKAGVKLEIKQLGK